MKFSCAVLLVVAPLVAACTGPVIMGADAVAIVATKPAALPPADTKDQIPEHESWCYTTLGEPQCYPRAQDVPAERLITVDPQNRYPLDTASYHEAVIAKPAAVAAPTALIPAPDVEVEKRNLKEELNTVPPASAAKAAP